jgi:heme-degrading monooxygenase HmoA
MYAILWEFVPHPGRQRDFEAAYGPDGPWARFFGEADGFVSTELLRDTDETGPYLTLDRWRSCEDYEAFVEARREEYERLNQEFLALTDREQLRGSFEILS